MSGSSQDKTERCEGCEERSHEDTLQTVELKTGGEERLCPDCIHGSWSLVTDGGQDQGTVGHDGAGREAQIKVLAPLCQEAREADSDTMERLWDELVRVYGKDVASSAWSRAEQNDIPDTVQHKTVTKEHQRVVESAYSHMDLSEHVTWLLGDLCGEVNYPQRVTVRIEVEEVDD